MCTAQSSKKSVPSKSFQATSGPQGSRFFSRITDALPALHLLNRRLWLSSLPACGLLWSLQLLLLLEEDAAMLAFFFAS